MKEKQPTKIVTAAQKKRQMLVKTRTVEALFVPRTVLATVTQSEDNFDQATFGPQVKKH